MISSMTMCVYWKVAPIIFLNIYVLKQNTN